MVPSKGVGALRNDWMPPAWRPELDNPVYVITAKGHRRAGAQSAGGRAVDDPIAERLSTVVSRWQGDVET